MIANHGGGVLQRISIGSEREKSERMVTLDAWSKREKRWEKKSPLNKTIVLLFLLLRKINCVVFTFVPLDKRWRRF